jgi:hypothetical protein
MDLTFTFVDSDDLTIFNPWSMNVWNNDANLEVVPVSQIRGSFWVRSVKDGTKLVYNENVFFDTFAPIPGTVGALA